MLKDGIDYLVAYFRHWKLLLTSVLVLWAIGFFALSMLPEESRIIMVMSIGSNATVPSDRSADISIELIENLPAVAFRLENLFLPIALENAGLAGTDLEAKQFIFEEQHPDLVLVEARATAEELASVKLLMSQMAAVLIADHNASSEINQANLLNDLNDATNFIERLERKQGDADLILEEEQNGALVLDTNEENEETRRFQAWSKLVYGVQASSSLVSQHRIMLSAQNGLKRAISLSERTTIDLEPTRDPATSYGPGSLLSLILSFLFAVTAGSLLVGLRILVDVVRKRDAGVEGQA